MDYDYKRLRGILMGFQDKQGDEYVTKEYTEREKVAEMLNHCTKKFQEAFKE